MSLRTQSSPAKSLRNVFLCSAAAFAAVSAPALAAPTIIGSGAAVPMDRAQVQSAGKTTQIRFDDGSVISFVGAARYVITGERQIRVESGSITVLGGSLPLTIQSGGTTVTVTGGAALTVGNGQIDSHVFSGTTEVRSGRTSKRYTAGQAWRAQGGSLNRVIAAGPQAVTPVANLRQTGISGAALNGLPVVLGEALAALGASSDIVAAGRSFDAVQQGVFDASAPALPRDLDLLLGFQATLAARLGGGTAFQGGSPAIIDTYLRYLAGGGRIAEFQTAYTALITSYLDLLSTGGSPADFDALGGLDIQAYLDYLQSVNGLGRLGDAQQSLIAEYIAFIQAGGDPSIFIASTVQLTPDVIALYQSILGDFVAFVRGGGVAAEFDGANADLVARYIRLLASAGQLDALFGAQADVLQAYADFLVAGGTPGNFDRFDEFGLSEALIADYTVTLQTYLTFLFNGGSVTGFDVDAATLAQFIVELDQADALGGDLADRRAVLLEFAAFVRAGNPANDFFGFFAAGLSDAAIAQYSTSISGLLSVYAMGGSFADYTGDLADIVRVIQILEAAGQLDDEFASQRVVLLQFVSFINGGGAAADFDGFIALGFDAATVASYVASINTILNFVFEGGDLANFDGDVTAIITLVNALETSGQLQGALSAQRAVLLEFVAFIEGGGVAANFDGFLALGLSDMVVQDYSESITLFLQFLIDGGEIGDFPGDLALILSNINDLQSAGRLSGEFSGATLDALLAYAAFIADGGAPADFTGFDDLTDTGGGGNPDTGEGVSGGPEVNVVAGVDRDAIANFAFRGPTGAIRDNSRGVSNTYVAARPGRNAFIGTAEFEITSNTRDDDGLPSAPRYSVRDMDLVAAGGSGDVLLTRHTGSGTASIGGQFSTYDGNASLNTAFVANPSTLLPTSGQIIYDLSDTLSIDTLGDYEGDITLDAVLGLRLGAVPTAAVNGVLGADVDYVFSTGSGDASAGIDFANAQTIFGTYFAVSANFVSGEGAFCSQVTSCQATFALRPTSDFGQLGGTFRTSSFSDDDLVAYTAVSFLARNGFEIDTTIPDVTPSGSVIAPFGADRANLLTAVGGAENRQRQIVRLFPQSTLAFDEQGLSVMFPGFSNSVDRGDGAVADLAGDTDWQVGRWVGLIGPDIFAQNSGLSYAIVPLINGIPGNGRVDYELLGATSPVYGDGSTAPGIFEGSAVLIIDTTAMFGIDATITMPDAVYTMVSTGGLDDPSIQLFAGRQRLGGFGSQNNVVTTMTGDGAACVSGPENCNVNMQITAGGDDAQYAGISYLITDYAEGSTGLTGAAVFGGDLVLDDPETGPEGIEREGQHVVYASTTIGIDSRDPATVIYDETTGAPLAYTWNLNDFTSERERPQIGTAVQREAGSAGDVLGWARWTEGTSAGRYYDTGDIVLPANAGWHVLSGTPATNLPTSGTVSYDLIGNTNPTRRDGTVAPGTLDSAQAAVQFGTVSRVGVELGMTVGGEGYNISTIGGVSDLSQGLELTADQEGRVVRFNGNAFNGTLLGSGGSLCAGTTANCNASLTGFLAGDGASHMGLAYTLGNVGFDSQVDGTAAFAAATNAAAQALDYKPDYRLTSPVMPVNPLSVGSPVTVDTQTRVAPPVIDETWTRWTQPSGSGSGFDMPVSEPGAMTDPALPQGGIARVPDWIKYDIQ